MKRPFTGTAVFAVLAVIVGFAPAVNHFGGSSTTEFGPLLKTVYPEAGNTTTELYNNFNSGDTANPCPVR